MTKNSINPKVDEFLRNAKKWGEEMARAGDRAGLPAEQEVKWGKPCYTIDGGNIAIIQDFKDYCAIMFFKGALRAPRKPAGEPLVLAAARQMRFTRLDEIAAQEVALRLYIAEAVAAEKAGLKVESRSTAD